jgi:hypothetical protein
MVCCRCDRPIEDTEAAIYSARTRKHYCAPTDWAECDAVYKAKIERMRAEDAA